MVSVLSNVVVTGTRSGVVTVELDIEQSLFEELAEAGEQ